MFNQPYVLIAPLWRASPTWLDVLGSRFTVETDASSSTTLNSCAGLARRGIRALRDRHGGRLSYFEDVARGEGDEFTPAQALLAGVLEIALQDFARRGESSRVRRYRSNAWRWLFGTTPGGDGLAFEYICEALNLQPDAVRKLVLAGRVQVFPLAGRTSPRRRHGMTLPRESAAHCRDDAPCAASHEAPRRVAETKPLPCHFVLTGRGESIS